jgi:hypothetical protein
MIKIRNECRGIKVGDKVGRLRIAGPFFGIPLRKSKNGRRWVDRRWYAVTECECGVISVRRDMDMANGDTQSCGCFVLEVTRRPRKHGHNRRSGRRGAYNTWVGMKDRCTHPSHKQYHRYGGRGIRVCAEWAGSYEAFWEWCKVSGYRDGLTIDRINQDGNYEPSNCQWLTRAENSSKRWRETVPPPTPR